MSYVVVGCYHQSKNVYNEVLLREFEDKQDAEEYALGQDGAWECVEVREV